jgi:hypothetical protein
MEDRGMNFVFTQNGVRIGRDSMDKKCKTETEVIYRVTKNVPNAHRFNPSHYGLTSSKIGFYIGSSIRKSKELYWHGNYAIESARDAFNKGSLFLIKV